MGFPAGTQLWVKCEDGYWWPAVARDCDADALQELGADFDMCVGFYHDRDNLYPIAFGDADRVRLFHCVESERDEAERELFSVPTTQSAVRLALEAGVSTAPREESVTAATPYSAHELRCISALLGAVNHTAASQLRSALVARGGVDLSPRNVRRAAARERMSRKRPASSNSSAIPSAPSVPSLAISSASSLAISSASSLAIPSAVPLAASASPAEGFPFCEPFDAEALEFLRCRVFEGGGLVLSPLYRFLDLLGAVSVDGAALTTTLPSPLAVREAPRGGFAPSRRVLLLPLAAAAAAAAGWMQPLDLEGGRVAMSMAVNGAPVETPRNWALPAGREAAARKTAPVADITALVMRRELFSLDVHFTAPIADAALWSGVIAAVFVDATDIATLARDIVSNYKTPRRRGGRRGAVVGVQVRPTCPLTSLPLQVPVRGAACEHGQCMELHALLLHCTRANVWNCPLCWAPTEPRAIMVNYRLKEWLETNHSRIGEVEFIVETPFNEPLRAVWKRKNASKDCIIAVE